MNRRSARLLAASVAAAVVSPAASALGADVSAPVMLQYFESSWKTMQKRTPDIFMAGYGAIWTPPPGRALYDDQGGGIGYNLYDRFDMGKAGDSTLYGTENQYRAMVKGFQRANGSVYVDYIHHHVGSWDVNGEDGEGEYTGANGFVPAWWAKIRDRSDYPGFELSKPYVGSSPPNNPNYRNLPGHRDSYPDPPPVPDGGTSQYQYMYRLAHLVTIDLTSGRSFVRNPVPGEANNIRQSDTAWAIGTSTLLPNGKPGAATVIRQANTPTNDNRRFYPDQQLPGITVTDPATGGGTYTIHPFNKDNPLAGDPVSETNMGYMMRYAQWLVNDIGVDGLRVDAARHVPYLSGDPYNPDNLHVPNMIDRAVFKQGSRYNLDGTLREVYSFQEVFHGDKGFLQQFVRKDINPATPTVVGGNRDVLDFPMWFAMRSNLTSNGLTNNWYNIRHASQDSQDDALANNGSQSIGFVYNHDDGRGHGGSDFIHLDNVAHAWILTRPGQAHVYFNSHEFDRDDNNEFFLKDGRGDALGGQFGNIITKLIDIRNSYGRGNFQERWIDGGGFSNIYAYERQGSMIVGLNSALGTVTNYDQRTMGSAFPVGTRLEEQTGNAANPQVDPLGEIPSVITVGAGGSVTMRIPRNQNTSGVEHGKGYVIYGLPRPQGDVTISNVAQVLGTEHPGNNATARVNAIDVITANGFNITLNTNKRILSDAFHDHHADGDRAYVRIDEGLNINGNGGVDFISPGDTRYGFENFVTLNDPGFDPNPLNSGAGQYVQFVDAAALSEGYHYITARAYRHQSFAGEQDVFTDFKKVIYVDRLPPPSAVSGITQTGSGAGRTLNARIQSLDQTGDSVHILMDTGAALTDAQVLALVNAGNKATQVDQDLFDRSISGITNGTHVMTVVMYEITGNYSILRATGVGTSGGNGLGFGDTNADGVANSTDISQFRTALESNNQQFNAGAEANTDGLINVADAFLLGPRLMNIGATPAAISDYNGMINSSPAVLNATYIVDANHTVLDITAAATNVLSGNTLNARSFRGGTLDIANTATVNLNARTTGAPASVVSELALTGSAQLNLRDNNLIIRNTAAGSFNGTNYTGVSADVQRGRNTGSWDGSGIVTSMPLALSQTTTLAVASASEILDITGAQTTTWSGLTVAAADTLVMYTYSGDANFSGNVDADDYFAIDSNYNKPAAGLTFSRGDFNYSGHIDGDDYFLIDASFIGQGGSLAGAGAGGAEGVTSVPEPGIGACLALAVFASRRRRR